MKESLARDDLLAALHKMGDDLTAQAETLRELDAAIGDGDLGITMTIGFGALQEALETLADQDMSTILMRAGMAFNRKAASTFGALFATMTMRAAREVRGVEAIGVAELARMATAALEGVKERGKADVGDKTMLDALAPAAEALQGAAEEGLSLAEALERAAEAACQGAQATVEMKSKVGRAGWFSDRTQGVQDPGAAAIHMMARSLAEYVATT
jgi:phosphoenolpyruvate---glycerone phosphotransferase subunit DhaL